MVLSAMRKLAAFMLAAALVACGSAAGVGTVAAPYSNIDLGACLRIARGETAAAEDLCPGFIHASLVGSIEICSQVGGELVAMQQSSLQSLDVSGDGQAEFLFDFAENYQCDGAPSVFSCGSLGCPVLLTERRDGLWRTIGLLDAGDAVAAEALSPEPGSAYGMLRGGCVGVRPCDELTYYRWDGSAYSATMIEAGGHWVDIAPGGLQTLVIDSAVLAAPLPGAAVLEHYPMGTEVVVIGDARGAPYKYVSPCNSCKSGFVEPAVLQQPESY